MLTEAYGAWVEKERFNLLKIGALLLLAYADLYNCQNCGPVFDSR